SNEITLEVRRRGNQNVQLDYLPAFSLRAHVLSAEVNRRPAKFSQVPANEVDQHVELLVPITGDSTIIRVRLRDDFGIVYPFVAPATGAVSSNLRFVSEHWNAAHDRLELQIAGVGGANTASRWPAISRE